MTNELIGTSIIGYRRGATSGVTTYATNPATGEALEPPFHSAAAGEVDGAAKLASRAFEIYSRSKGCDRAKFLRKIATNIESIKDDLVERATQETGLPAARIQMETGRTANQLRMFADLVEEGSWVDARIDRAMPDRKPLPRADIRSMLRPIGPVVVFCASNFPLAFSVAGGDTASAFAAGNPVIVKAHHAHPGTAELVGVAIADAARECGMPEGVFSLLFGSGNEVGQALVRHPLVKAAGFTGSRRGGEALMRIASSRPEPIPFYAEMSSINPVFILPGAMKERAEQIASGLHASVTLGVGQFCTNPGLVVVRVDDTVAPFVESLSRLIEATTPAAMLTSGIHASYCEGVDSRLNAAEVEMIACATNDGDTKGFVARAALFRTDAETFLTKPELSEEVFGPSTLLVTHSEREQMLEIARNLEGHLTATIHGTEDDLRENADLIEILERKVGRLVFNGFPTGVEVCSSMVHGGPFPATSDGRSTSVGTRSIYRFVRAVCYQDFPDSVLPDELKDANPLGIRRVIDGVFFMVLDGM